MTPEQTIALQNPCLLSCEYVHPRFKHATLFPDIWFILVVDCSYTIMDTFKSPVWHASAAVSPKPTLYNSHVGIQSGFRVIAPYVTDECRKVAQGALQGVSLGEDEWHEKTDHVYHIKRRVSKLEIGQFNLQPRDVRFTREGVDRVKNVIRVFPDIAEYGWHELRR